MDGNYIKLNRSILKWEWFSDINTSRLFIYMLLRANWADEKFRGVVIPRGSFVSSVGKLAEDTDLTEREIRTAISHLKSTGEVTSKSTNRFTVFTVVNYCLYQTSDKQGDIQSPSKRQANDKLTTTIEEYKEKKEEKNNNIKTIGRFTPPSVQEVADYCLSRNNGIDAQSFIDFYASKGWMIGKNKMKDWKAAVRTWESSRKEKASTTKPDNNKFNQFPQRDYDFNELEKALLNK